MTEWRPIPGFEGAYEVSNTGLVRSVDRIATGQAFSRFAKGRTLSPGVGPLGYRRVNLYSGKRTPSSGRSRGNYMAVHRLVLIAFVEPPPFEKAEACHIDGNPANNHVANLYWGTRAENIADMERHGTAHWVTRTHCPQGHEYTPENTQHCTNKVRGERWRRCRACNKEQQRRYQEKRRLRTTEVSQ